ncbi:MAG: hypothetical protein LUE65_08755 [Clostridiales bacterium]|nr:hypothetical protein [Clostridiales bacterium]
MKPVTYNDYVEMDQTISFAGMEDLHQRMIDDINNDPDAMELYDELAETAARYALIRARWKLLSTAEKAETDASRTACHNSLIVKFNQLARYLRQQGKTAEWRDILGYEEDNRINRKRIGDFGCYIAFVNGINAR